MNGAISTVLSSPNSSAVTWRTVAAISGTASCVICVPKTETVSAVQSLRKSGWRSRLRDRSGIAGESTSWPARGSRPAPRLGL